MKISYKSLFMEFVGTFFLTFAVFVSINNPDFGIPTPVIASITLGIFVYTIGNISGCHINPAVTLGIVLSRKIDLVNGLGYIASQFAGAIAASFFLLVFVANPVQPVGTNNSLTILAEVLGTFLFVFGISAVVFENTIESFKGIIIGASLFLGISIASIGSLGILNPAVALGVGSFSPAYILGPAVGSMLGFMTYNFIVNSHIHKPAIKKQLGENKVDLPPLS